MMSKKINTLLFVAFLATLVFAVPRTGKKQLFGANVVALVQAKNVAAKNMNASSACALDEWSEVTTDVFENTSVKDSESFDEGNVEFRFNGPSVALPEMHNWRSNVLRSYDLLGKVAIQRMYGFHTYDAYYAYRANRYAWYGFETIFVSNLFGLSAESNLIHEYQTAARNGSHVRTVVSRDEHAPFGAWLGWNSTRSFRRRRRSGHYAKLYFNIATSERIHNVEMIYNNFCSNEKRT